MSATVTTPREAPRRDALQAPAPGMSNRSPLELLILSRQGLSEASEEADDGTRYAVANVAALRAAAAVLAVRSRTDRARRGRVTNVWSLLVHVAPELSEWADYFAWTARRRAMALAGVERAVTSREADDMVRDADHFVAVVTELIGLR